MRTSAIPPAPTFSQRGFTLTELAVVLVIVALLIGGMMIPLSAQQDIRARQETEKTMTEVRDALIGHALVNSYLPCPASPGSPPTGLEATRDANGACPIRVGLVPWATLGLGRFDGWNHLIRYSVAASFSNSGAGAGARFTLSSTGDITVQTRDAAGALQTLAANVPAALVSHGARAAHAYSETGQQIADSPNTNTDEDTNGTGDGTTVVSRIPTSAGADEIDDIVIWLSANTLFNRMITAGKLP